MWKKNKFILCAMMYPLHSKHPRPSKRKSRIIVKSASVKHNSCVQGSERSELMHWQAQVWPTMLPGSTKLF